MLRLIGGVAAGFVAFMALFMLSPFVVRPLWPEMGQIDDPLNYTTPMLVFRLVLGVLYVVVGGLTAGWVSRRKGLGGLILGGLFLALFAAMHISIWDSFPVWYHLAFLGYLVPLAWLGARLAPVKVGASKTAP